MKPILYILALLVTCGAAYLSYDLSGKFTSQQKLRLDANKRTSDLVVQQTATDKDLRVEQTNLKKVQDDKTATDQAIETAKSVQSGLKTEAATLDTTLADQKVQIDQVNKAIEEVKTILKGIGDDVTIANIGDKVKDLTNQKLELEKKRDDLAANIEGATKARDSKKAEGTRLVEVKTKRDKHISQNSTESVITAVNQEWGFVMVGSGSNTGFTPQTKLLVQRDGRLIGKLQPTSIEPNQTLADIDFDSLAAGVRLQPGDKVILADPATN